MQILFFKSHVKGYTKQDGTVVTAHENKVHKKPATAQWPGWNSKKPLDLEPDQSVKVSKVAESKPKWSSGQGSLFGHSAFDSSKSIVHPAADDNDKPVKIYDPCNASDPKTWSDASAIALFTPAGAAPAELNGIALSPWLDHPKTDEGWDYVDGQMEDLAEPPLHLNGKAPAAGVIIEEPDGRIWVVRPTNGFAGYQATFPKGHSDEGLSLQATAIKECFEESGLKVEITGFLGDIERGQTMARYYRARRVGGTPTAMGWETQGVALVPPSELHAYVNRNVDREVADLAGVARPASLSVLPGIADDWKQVGKQSGSNPGGVFLDPDGQKWYCKFPKSANIAKNEVLAGKLYEALDVRVPSLKLIERDGKVGVASALIDGLQTARHDLVMGEVAGVHDGFVADAWLANWDVVGLLFDNLMVDQDGQPVRVDLGGSLLYRAQGEPKGAAFGDKVGELKTLIDGKNQNSTTVFGGITKAEIRAGIDKVAAVPDETIRDLCLKYGAGGTASRNSLADTLINRKNYLIKQK